MIANALLVWPPVAFLVDKHSAKTLIADMHVTTVAHQASLVLVDLLHAHWADDGVGHGFGR